MVPGEVKGMYVAWENHGQLSWAELIEPSIKIARDGFKITPPIAQAIKAVERDLDSGEYPGLQYVFTTILYHLYYNIVFTVDIF